MTSEMDDKAAQSKLARYLSIGGITLLFSTGTLICCALPILLVTVGLGATVAAMTSASPLLVTLAHYKAWLFAWSGLLVALAGWLVYRAGNLCPADPDLAALCERLRRWNKRVFCAAAAIWVIGFFAAYLLLPIRIRLDI
jgi:mercuric ion transport protein